MSLTRPAHAVPRGSLADRARRNIGARLKSRRLPQRALAVALDVSQQAVSDRLTGRTPFPLQELEVAAETLEMDLLELFAPIPAGDEVTVPSSPADSTPAADLPVQTAGAVAFVEPPLWDEA